MRLRREFYCCLSYVAGGCREEETDSLGGHSGRNRQIASKKILTSFQGKSIHWGVVKPYNRGLEGAELSPSLEIFKTGLDKFLNNLI